MADANLSFPFAGSLLKKFKDMGDGTYAEVITVSGLTVTADSINLDTADVEAKLGIITETAPATDIASSGLNGRLQRVSQRITSLIALLPAALGAGGGLKTEKPEDQATLTKAAVSMTGASGVLVGASAARLSVMVSNPAANAVAAIDPTGGTCSLTAGIPIGPGATIEITGKAAQSAMTQIGTNAQVLTVYVGA